MGEQFKRLRTAGKLFERAERPCCSFRLFVVTNETSNTIRCDTGGWLASHTCSATLWVSNPNMFYKVLRKDRSVA